MSVVSDLKENIQRIRELVGQLSPENCCVKKPMRTSDGKTTMLCDIDCPWLELEHAVATAQVEAGMIPDDP